MPELPEVEVLVRHLRGCLIGKQVTQVEVFRPRSIRPTDPSLFRQTLTRARFTQIERRGKFMLFTMKPARARNPAFPLVGHLGMSGRMYVTRRDDPLPRHVPVRLALGHEQFVFEDTRYFGRLSLDLRSIEGLGPEPLSDSFTEAYLGQALARSTQPIKVKLLDQSLVAGVGNIYASESLFHAGISPRMQSQRLKPNHLQRLKKAIQEVLREAIQFGSTLPLDFSGQDSADGFFYYGAAKNSPANSQERLLVYDRENKPCFRCGARIRRMVQVSRSTFYCPQCQPG